jgi:gamma-glutamylcyclotransferase (GGCT)/AIG2-like uncharacterized protein YtfP
MTTDYLYAYGTLQVPAIFENIVGRALEGYPATLEGYACHRMRERVYPAIVRHAGGRVAGLVYAGLSSAELDRLDHYEGEFYERRVLALFAGGARIEAHAYVLRSEHRHRLSSDTWDLDAFIRDHLASYLKRIRVTSKAP